MYLVEPAIFKSFLDKRNFTFYKISLSLPCLVEFSRDGILYAKVETISPPELFNVMKFGKPFCEPKNKYWIRGEEWEKDSNGEYIKQLRI